MNNDLISRQYLQKQFQDKCETDCLLCDYDSPYGCGLIDNAPSVIPKQEPYEDAISRQAVIDTCLNIYFNGYKIKDLIHDIKNLPSVNPQEPRIGHWIALNECSNSGYYCSECHKKVVKEGWSDTVKIIKFCPNCGIKMKKENES